MPSIIHCPACKQSMQLPDHWLNRSVQCPRCREVFLSTHGLEEAVVVEPPLGQQSTSAVQQGIGRVVHGPYPELTGADDPRAPTLAEAEPAAARVKRPSRLPGPVLPIVVSVLVGLTAVLSLLLVFHTLGRFELIHGLTSPWRGPSAAQEQHYQAHGLRIMIVALIVN